MIYADSGILMRLVEGLPEVREQIETQLRALERKGPLLCTSRLALLECRCRPQRDGNTDLLALYDDLFASDQMALREVDAAVIDKATELRAMLALRTPDAIHAATAILSSVEAFWTTDGDFRRCPDLTVVLFQA